jgi:hypothetical protein
MIGKINGYIFIIIIIIIIFIWFHYNINETFNNNFDLHIYDDFEIVIARYNENMNYIMEQPFKNLNVTCYNKGINHPLCNLSCNIFNIPNVGRCDHTFLYHIINNYDNLAPITIFLPASCMDKHKVNKTLKTLELALKTKNSVIIGIYLNDVAKELYNFQLDEYVNSNEENKAINPEVLLEKSPIRPYGKWYKHIFGDIKINIVDYYSILAISKQDILKYPRDYYINIISYIDKHSNPEAGHYIERSWAAIFHPIDPNCLYYE